MTKDPATRAERRVPKRQADHPLTHGSDEGGTASDDALRLIHLKAYAEAARRSTGRSILDIGCNDGYGTTILARTARQVTGVDVSPRAIKAAKARPDAGEVDFRLIDGASLPFPDSSFDLVTAFQVIEHVDDVRPFLDEIRRVTAPDGTVLFTTPNASIRLDPGMAPWNPFHVREYTAPELEAELTSVFPSVVVRGLFAPEPLAEIELARAAAARERARHPRPMPLRLILRVLPASLKAPLRRLRRGPAGTHATRVDYSVDDLWLADDGLDLALDLHAVCSLDATELNAGAGAAGP